MKRVTVSVDEETHRLACLRAEELETSVPALVRDYLANLANGVDVGMRVDERVRETEHARRVRLLTEVLADFESRGVGLDMADNLTRDEIYDRNALGA